MATFGICPSSSDLVMFQQELSLAQFFGDMSLNLTDFPAHATRKSHETSNHINNPNNHILKTTQIYIQIQGSGFGLVGNILPCFKSTIRPFLFGARTPCEIMLCAKKFG